MKNKKAYLVLIAFELTCIGIKYEVSKTNPFQQSTLLLLLTAVFSHVLASAADINNPITIITFHISGMLASQTLLWILIPQLLWFSLINFLLLLLVKFLFFDVLSRLFLCSFNCITQLFLCSFNCITQLLSASPPNLVEMPNTELQPQESEV